MNKKATAPNTKTHADTCVSSCGGVSIQAMWKTIEGFDNYEVSDQGEVRRKDIRIVHSNGQVANYKMRPLKPDISNSGYCRVTLSIGNRQTRLSVHRIVADHFLAPDPSRPHVNHKNGNRLNNAAINLEWVTVSENEKHSYDVLGKVNANRKLTKEQAADVKGLKGVIGSRALAKKYGVSKSVILHIFNRKTYVGTSDISN